MSPEKLIIFDYSGTLSLEAPLFARPDQLMKHLGQSGLTDFGIDSPATFWEEIVNPTWTEGSTTSSGYKKVLEKRLRSVSDQNRSVASRVRLPDAVSAFVDSYFSHSRIDYRWKSTLRKLYNNSSIGTIIATDHYAEATDFIVKSLKEFEIEAAPAKEVFANPHRTVFIIANSADLGVHKSDARFWEILKSGLNIDDLRSVTIIDDFGSNEQRGDRYAELKHVHARREKTVRMLETVFQAEIRVIPFMIGDEASAKDDVYENLFAISTAAIEQYMTPPC
jgi:hypothetical protein